MNDSTMPDDLPHIPDGKPLLVVMSAPSGAGKDAVRELMRDWGFPAHFVVTATTRPRTSNEVHGRDYFFVDEREFDRLERNNELIESANVYGRRYGVPRDEVLLPLQAGKNVVARVDVQGAETLKRLVPDALLIFIAPPSLQEAQDRLLRRDRDSSADVQVRVDTAASEMEAAKDFDYVVVNETGQLEAAVRRVFEIIASEKAKRAAT
jgi:guanylate kinase